MEQKEEKKLAKPADVLRVYWAYAKKESWLLSLIVFLSMVLQVTNLVAPLYLRTLFNTLAANQPSAAVVATLISTLGFVVLMWFLNWAATRAQDVTNIYYSARVMQSLYKNSFEYLMGHSYNFFISNFAGTLTHRVSRFARSFEVISDSVLIQFLPTLLFVVGASAVLFVRNHILGTALFLWSVAFIAFQIYIARVRQPSRNARAEAETKVTGVLADSISNQATVIQFSGTTHETGLFGAAVERWRHATLRSWLVDSFTWGVIGLFVIGIQAGLLYGAVLLWRQGLLTVGDFVLIQSYLLSTFGQLMGISYQLRRFYDAFADAEEMVYVLNLPHEIIDKVGAQPLVVREGEVWFDNLNFRFGRGKQVLKDFNLTIKGAEKIALVGPSGAGKSTVTKLLLRLYDLPRTGADGKAALAEGEIKIDKQNIADVTQESLRDAISFVPQEPILFHRTLMENIRYGRRTASDAEVIEAAKKAHCHEFISGLPQQYDTFVGERGIKLSGGERQRVAIARAILKNAPILVLDEATSSLDSESEALIQDALEVLMEGKTVIVIAHRLSTIMKMDRIVVMERGSIVATGTHLELINQRGLYQKLWSIQAGGFLGGAEKDEEKVEEDIEALAEEDDEDIK